MKNLFVTFLLIFFSGNIHAQNSRIPMVGFPYLAHYLSSESDTVYVLNFWATWCGPCRREIPSFEKIHLNYSGQKVKVLLVSLDFPDQLNKGLKQFLGSNNITANAVLLNEPDANAWISQVDPAWTGSLPATLIYKGPDRMFFEKELTYEDISHSINALNP